MIAYGAAGAGPAHGCQCEPPKPPCEAASETDAVFVGTVVGTDPFWLPRLLFKGEDAGPKRYRFRIDEAFWGIDSDEVVVGMDGFFAGCGFFFGGGQKYLVYAWRQDSSGLFRTSGCSRTQLAERATEDLDYLRRLRRGQASTQVYGLATRNGRERFYPPDQPRTAPIAGATIHLESATRSWTTTTSGDGTYLFSGLPPGWYRVQADPGNLRARARRVYFKLGAGDCAVRDFVGYP
jgi:hypothetical protein